MNKEIKKLLYKYSIHLNKIDSLIINFDLGYISIKEDNIEKTYSISPYEYKGYYLYLKK